MRIHLSVAALVFPFSLVFGLSAAEYALLFLTIGAVLAAEAINTGMELIIDLVMPAYHNLARIGKDVAAGAVLLMALGAVAVGGCLFLRFPKLWETLGHIAQTPALLLLFLFLLVLGVCFSLWGDRLFRGGTAR